MGTKSQQKRTYLEHTTKGSLAKVADVDDAVAVILKLLQFGVQLGAGLVVG